MNEPTATQRMIQDEEVNRAHDWMCRASELERAERIATHYLCQVATAKHLLQIIQLARHQEMTDNVKSAIVMLRDQLVKGHSHDLGLELSWPKYDEYVFKHPVIYSQNQESKNRPTYRTFL